MDSSEFFEILEHLAKKKYFGIEPKWIEIDVLLSVSKLISSQKPEIF